jgi:hypothetical protein
MLKVLVSELFHRMVEVFMYEKNQISIIQFKSVRI